jgi:hypothetical protein
MFPQVNQLIIVAGATIVVDHVVQQTHLNLAKNVPKLSKIRTRFGWSRDCRSNPAYMVQQWCEN